MKMDVVSVAMFNNNPNVADAPRDVPTRAWNIAVTNNSPRDGHAS